MINKTESTRKVLLCILDGLGYNPESFGNSTLAAASLSKFMNDMATRSVMSGDDLVKFSGTFLEASGRFVGLPDGQCGNSEVGHLTIGSGRVRLQKLPLITEAIKSGSLDKNETLRRFLDNLREKCCHVMVLFSNGGVHSDVEHFFWAISILRQKKVKIMAHLFLDGRDVGPFDALDTLELSLKTGRLLLSEIATIQGRFFAMDRDNRCERTRAAFDAIVYGKTEFNTNDPVSLIKSLYEKNVNDEVMPPFTIGDYNGTERGDEFWMLNFRTDRIKQILGLLCVEGFRVLNMVNCGVDLDARNMVLFEQKEIPNILGELISKQGLKQLRIAETEKYAHVTYFFNGGSDIQYENEHRILIPSPKVSDYAETPDMSSSLVVSEILKSLDSRYYDVIIANLSNADMIGHTGNYQAARLALQFLDQYVIKIIERARRCGYTLIVTSDHGNAEKMINADRSINKSHTCSMVPFMVFGEEVGIRGENGQLADIAPTILDILGLSPPSDMTGKTLLIR
jgi:2,3-bisphosphoglycerate-independent phosphoglycerate mutase